MNRSKKDREIQSLTDRLAALKGPSGGAKKKKKPRKKQPSGGSTPGTSGQLVTQGPSRKRGGRGGGAAQGDMRLRRRELFASLKANRAGTLSSRYGIQAKTFSWLKTVSAAFERVRFYSVRIWYTPAVGATKNGMVAYGVDYSFKKFDPDHKKVAALTPSISHPVWQSSQSNPLVIPLKMLQSRAWYILDGTDVDTGPGQVYFQFDGDADIDYLGDLWVEYDVELAGTVFQ